MLKSLEIYGFKSFADRTRFEFPPGITCIVGPNGSGKSNVVDAVKWVLGDQSPKSLRGKEMTDVIFNGSSSRKPAQFAEAILTFDNRSRFLPVDRDEVQVGRRIWRNGDAEYLLDGAVARLRDIRELFTGTGAGAVSYCVIEQGRVDQILQSNPTARRAVFEEAAGISRYRSRRTEALRRLERVTQNLQRLQDIVDELESQRNALRSQAEKAAIHRELSQELRRWWVGLAADDYRRLQSVRQSLVGRLEVLQRQLQAYEQELAGLQQQLNCCEEAAHQMQRQLARLNQRWADVREQMAADTTTLKHLLARIEELETDLRRQRRQLWLLLERQTDAEARLTAVSRERDRRHDEYAAAQRKLEQLQQQQRELQQQRSELQSERDRLVRALAESRQQMQADQTRLTALLAEREQLGGRLHSLDARLQELQRRREEAVAAYDDTRAAHRRLAERLAETDRELAEIERERQRLREQAETLQQTVQRLREDRSAVAARVQLLDEWEERDGAGADVRELLTRAGLADHGPFAAMDGCLADHFDVTLEDAALVDVALGDRSQLILIRNWDAVLQYLARHSSEFRGRLGFASAETTMRATSATGSDDHRPEHTGAGRSHQSPDRVIPNAAGAEDDRHGRTSDARVPPEATVGDASGVHRLEDPEPDTILEASPPSGPRQESRDVPPIPQPHYHRVRKPAEVPVPAPAPLAASPRQEPPAQQPGPTTTGAPETRAAAQPALPGVPQGEGILGRLMDRIRCTAAARPILEALLGRTWVVETLYDAWQLFHRYPGRYEWVTLQGERIDQCGVVYAGTLSAEHAVVTRRSERRALQDRLHEIEQQKQQCYTSLAQIRREEANLKARLAQLASRREGGLEELARLEQQVATAAERVQQCAEEQTAVENERAAAQTQLRELQTRIDQTRQQMRQREQQSAAINERLAELERTERKLAEALDELQQRLLSLRLEAATTEQRAQAARAELERLENERQQLAEMVGEVSRRLNTARTSLSSASLEWLNTRARRDHAVHTLQSLQRELDRLEAEYARHEQQRRTLKERIAELQTRERQEQQQQHAMNTELQSCEHRLQTLEERVWEEFHLHLSEAAANGESAYRMLLEELRAGATEPSPAAADADRTDPAAGVEKPPAPAEQPSAGSADRAAEPEEPPFEGVRQQIEERVQRLRRKLKALGNVNTDSLADLEALEERYTRLKTHLDDLTEARATLEELLRRINVESKRLFLQTLESIRENFRHFFRALFGGGSADIVLENPDEVLDCGIDIVARPPGKELRSISLLSGGEKTLTAIGLLFAIFRTRPSPFCILDEVDAALDEANIERYIAALNEFRQNTQFIMITHRKRTMRAADVLYGITMEESGVSKKLSVRWEDVDEQGNIRSADHN